MFFPDKLCSNITHIWEAIINYPLEIAKNHVYFGHEYCFGVVVLDGGDEEITELDEAIMALKGVKFS